MEGWIELVDSGWPAVVLGALAMPWLAYRVGEPRSRLSRAGRFAELVAVAALLAAALARWAMAQNGRGFRWNLLFALLAAGAWTLLLVPLALRVAPGHAPEQDPAAEGEEEELDVDIEVEDAAWRASEKRRNRAIAGLVMPAPSGLDIGGPWDEQPRSRKRGAPKQPARARGAAVKSGG